jgi:hypothetical protein
MAERNTRFTLVGRTGGKEAEEVTAVMAGQLGKLPESVRLSFPPRWRCAQELCFALHFDGQTPIFALSATRRQPPRSANSHCVAMAIGWRATNKAN